MAKLEGKKFSSEYQPEKNGRPKGLSSKVIINKELLRWSGEHDEDGNPLTKFAVMIRALIQKAIDNKDTIAFEKLMDRLEGKPISYTDLSISESAVKTINIIPASKVAKLNGSNGTSD